MSENNTNNQQPAKKNRMTAVILALCFGALGIHEFYLGNTKFGSIYLAVCLLFFPFCAFSPLFSLFALFVAWPCFLLLFAFSIIRAIIFLTKSDEEFHQRYVVEKRLF